MHFLTTSEKIKKLRNQLFLKQEDLKDEKVTRGLISMIETDKRDLSPKAASKIADKFNEKAEKLNIVININEDYLLRSPKEDAEIYCLKKLKNAKVNRNIIDRVFKISKQFELIEVRAIGYFKLGEIFENEKDFLEACLSYNKSIEIYKDINKNKKLGYIHWKIGECKVKIMKYDSAIEHYHTSQYYCLACGDTKTMKLCLYSLANSYKKLNKIDTALTIIEEYLGGCDENDDKQLYIEVNCIKATCYEAIDDYDTAADIYNVLLEKISDDKDVLVGYFYNNLGLDYFYKNNLKQSMFYFEMSEKFRFDIDKTNLAATLIEKSNVFIKQKKYIEAIKSIELGLTYAKNYNDMKYLLRGNYLLANIYNKSHNYKNLERIYLEIVLLIKENGDNNLNSIYNKLAILCLEQGKFKECKEYLLLAEVLYKNVC
ncbi:helix-turn-helix domain-containing protein [Clostridium akagii]|uniref:helix-turn-helix domain-containing protein n=1 Tax=Clostridium akagii TaxID=91623 RepID=UPI0004794149|nr:helix-turn-helix transcriptional regulator [Clostridium akagii]